MGVKGLAVFCGLYVVYRVLDSGFRVCVCVCVLVIVRGL